MYIHICICTSRGRIYCRRRRWKFQALLLQKPKSLFAPWNESGDVADITSSIQRRGARCPPGEWIGSLSQLMSCLSFFIKELLFCGGLEKITAWSIGFCWITSHLWAAVGETRCSAVRPKQRGLLLTNESGGNPPGGGWAVISSLCPTWATERTLGYVGLPCVTERREADCALVAVSQVFAYPPSNVPFNAPEDTLSCHSDPDSHVGWCLWFNG